MVIKCMTLSPVDIIRLSYKQKTSIYIVPEVEQDA